MYMHGACVWLSSNTLKRSGCTYEYDHDLAGFAKLFFLVNNLSKREQIPANKQ